MNDAQARLRALDPRVSFIVQAPAGSGKTELLTQRILSLLAHATTEPEEVLAITFTKKAAQEMRERVLSSITLGLGECPAEAHKQKTWELAQHVIKTSEALGWDLVNQPQRLNILTIDALCARLVRQMPILSKIGVMPEISTDPRSLYESAAIKTMDYLLDEKNSAAITLLSHVDNRLDKAVDMIADMLSYREQWLPIIMSNQDQDQARILLEDNLIRVISEKFTYIHALLKPYLVDLKPLIDFALSQGLESRHELLSALDISADPEIHDLDIWQALSSWLLTKEGELRRSVDKRMGFPAATEARDKEQKACYKTQKEAMKICLDMISKNEAAVDALQALGELPTALYDEGSWKVLSALITVLPQAAAMLMVHFDEYAKIDFSAISMAALLSLGQADSPSDLSLKIDLQISHILVDEFQDTSFMQYDLLTRLTWGWDQGDGRTLFLVGDPMQSIYRFRQAEVSLFLRAVEQGIGSIKLESLQLSMNFRSHSAVIAWINEAARTFFPSQSHIHLGAVPYTPSHAALTSDMANAGVYRHIVSDTRHESEAVLQVLQKALKEKHASIALLVRARTHLQDITHLLQASHIPYQAVELEPLSEKPVIQQLLMLTRLMIHLADRSAWLGLLRSSLCGLSIEDITLLCDLPHPCLIDCLQSMLEQNSLSKEGMMIMHRVYPLLREAIDSRQTRMLSASLRGLWIALGGPVTCQHPQSLEDAAQYFSLLSQYESSGTLLDTEHFIQRLEQSYASTQDHDAVIQVMTIHKAKGLEFDVVVLPGLSRRSVKGDNPIFVWDKMPTEDEDALLFAPIHSLYGEPLPLYQFIAKQRDKKDQFELSRLLYVALTRAKSQCHLFAILERDEDQGFKPPVKGSLAHRLWPAYAQDAIELKRDDPMHLVAPATQSLLKRLPVDWALSLCMPQAHRVQIEAGGDNAVDIEPFTGHRVRDRIVGTILHQALCDMASVHLMEVQPFQARWYALLLEKLGPAANDGYESLLTAIDHTLKDPRGRWILSKHQEERCEQSLLCQEQGRAQRYIIDRSFVDEQGRRWIIDYKSAVDEQADPQVFYAQARAQHAAQLEAYARAMQKRYPGPIHCGLYFPRMAGWAEWVYESDEELIYG